MKDEPGTPSENLRVLKMEALNAQARICAQLVAGALAAIHVGVSDYSEDWDPGGADPGYPPEDI